MKLERIFQVKWYHLVIGFTVILAVAVVLAYLFLDKDGVSFFNEDKTDIVE